jgi:stress response protein YsnF
MSGDVDQPASISLHSEQLNVRRLRENAGRVTVSTTTHTRTECVDELLVDEDVHVERIPRGIFVEEAPKIREIGDEIIIPVMEEILVTERRLFLKEEIHVRRIRTEHRHQETVALREEHVSIERENADTTDQQHEP